MKIEDVNVTLGHYYKCQCCGGHFKACATKEEVEKEAIENGFEDQELALVCDDCYKMLMEKYVN